MKINANTPLLLLLIGIMVFQFAKRVPVTVFKNQTQNRIIQNVPYLNYNTQRVPPFRQVGVLYKNESSLILPLYGRQTHVRSNTWNYYTTTEGDNPLQIEISIKERECLRKNGCKELYTDDSIFIPEYNGLFNVKMYL